MARRSVAGCRAGPSRTGASVRFLAGRARPRAHLPSHDSPYRHDAPAHAGVPRHRGRRSAHRHDPSRGQQERRAHAARGDAAHPRAGRARQHAAHPRRRDDARAARRPRRRGRVDGSATRCACAPPTCSSTSLDEELSERIRASILLAGPLLARFGSADVPLPGGDVIGRRRVDSHLLALSALGAEVTADRTYRFRAPAGSRAPSSTSTRPRSRPPRTRSWPRRWPTA